MEDGLSFRRRLNQAPLMRVAGDEVTKFLQEVLVGECREHQGGSRLFKKIMHLSYIILLSRLIHYTLLEDVKMSAPW